MDKDKDAGRFVPNSLYRQILKINNIQNLFKIWICDSVLSTHSLPLHDQLLSFDDLHGGNAKLVVCLVQMPINRPWGGCHCMASLCLDIGGPHTSLYYISLFIMVLARELNDLLILTWIQLIQSQFTMYT